MIKDILHLKAPGNWINDPNGFIYYKGMYHLFYQHFPYAPEWGTMHWGHAVSSDLVHWEHKGIALFPSKDYDRNGIFSGSALEVDQKLYLYYSAVRYVEEEKENIHLARNEQFETSQGLLVSEDGEHFDNFTSKRQIVPVITDNAIGDEVHTRDPKVWKSGDSYYMILGSTQNGNHGRVLFFRSEDALKWEYVGQHKNPAFGTILECPDLFPIGKDYVFLGSPMDINTDGMKYPHQSICMLAEFKEESCSLKLSNPYQMVDYGGDLYAPQTNLDKEGRRVMIAWMRMPKTVESKDRGLWNGMMCLPRVVEVEEEHIFFRVHPDVEQYFSNKMDGIVNIDWERKIRLKTVLHEGETLDIGGYEITAKDGRIRTNRSKVFDHLEGYHLVNETPSLSDKLALDIFVEPNLIEIFVNGGQYVMSNIVYHLTNEIKGHIEQIFIGNEE